MDKYAPHDRIFDRRHSGYVFLSLNFIGAQKRNTIPPDTCCQYKDKQRDYECHGITESAAKSVRLKESSEKLVKL